MSWNHQRAFIIQVRAKELANEIQKTCSTHCKASQSSFPGWILAYCGSLCRRTALFGAIKFAYAGAIDGVHAFPGSGEVRAAEISAFHGD
jgi:hypothetical protein